MNITDWMSSITMPMIAYNPEGQVQGIVAFITKS